MKAHRHRRGASLQPRETLDLPRTLRPESQSEVRPHKVTKAKALIRDPNYPTRAVLQKLAERLVRALKSNRLFLFLHL